jgi:ubiquinone/menaquinone biosynthesis C-methylase UbiE
MLTNYSYERLLTLIEKHPLPKDRPLRVLDIGVGTAVPLYHIWDKLPKNVDVMGVDIDHSYILKAQRLFKDIERQQGSRKVCLQEKNFYEMSAQANGTFDLIVFSSSFMLMPFRDRALELAKSLLNDDGKVLFILTLQPSQKKKSYLTQVLEYWKPKLKYLITIDFGQITYEDDFERLLEDQKLVTTYKERLSKLNNIPTKLFRVFLYETKRSTSK